MATSATPTSIPPTNQPSAVTSPSAAAPIATAGPKATTSPAGSLFLAKPRCQCSPNDLLCRASCELDHVACGCPDREVGCLLDCHDRATGKKP